MKYMLLLGKEKMLIVYVLYINKAIYKTFQPFIPKVVNKTVAKKPTQRSGVKRKRQEIVNQTATDDDHCEPEDQGIKHRLRRSSRLKGQVRWL